MNRHTHYLYGCSPEPLGLYLKALGIIRTVAQQADRSVKCYWEDNSLVLETELDYDALVTFFLEQYAPTPVVSPWLNSSGFGPEGKDGLQVIENSVDPRLKDFRSVIVVARRIGQEYIDAGWPNWPNKMSAAVSRLKKDAITQCRSEFPDQGLPWVDTAVIIAGDKPVWPPILGTGGNVARLDISRNFHEHLVRAIGLLPKKADDPRGWIEDALFDSVESQWIEKSASQFNPGASGGRNSAPLGKAVGLVNPWDFVLTVEGTMLFAGAITRRYSLDSKGTPSAPFMTYASPGGYSSLARDEAGSNLLKGEIWAPLWERPTSFGELSRLFAEGRADWGRRRVRTGLDLAKAAGSLGVDRGISSFARHIFALRDGKSAIAIEAGRVAIKTRSVLAPLQELDPWIDRVKQAVKNEENPPRAVRARLWEVENRSFAISSGAEPNGSLHLLVEVAKLESELSRARDFREKNLLTPVLGPTGHHWIDDLLVCSKEKELRLALVLASGRDVSNAGVRVKTERSLRTILRPVQFNDKSGRIEWKSGSPSVPGLGSVSVVELLARSHSRRLIDLMKVARLTSENDKNNPGIPTRWQRGMYVRLADVNALASGLVDEALLSEYLSACMLLDWNRVEDRILGPTDSSNDHSLITPPLSVLGPFFADQKQEPPDDGANSLSAIGPFSADQASLSQSGTDDSWNSVLRSVSLCPESSWPSMLALGRLDAVLRAAVRRLVIAGLQPLMTMSRSTGSYQAIEGVRLGAALLCRMNKEDRDRLLGKSCPEIEIPTSRGDSSVNKLTKQKRRY